MPPNIHITLCFFPSIVFIALVVVVVAKLFSASTGCST